jgi:solute carrier family 24 (sodium/potassium/calcium exchanger), member 4
VLSTNYNLQFSYLDSIFQRKILQLENEKELSSTNNYYFPTDTSLYTKHHREIHMIFHGLVASYIFWMLAIICDEYFIKAIEILCQSEYSFSFNNHQQQILHFYYYFDDEKMTLHITIELQLKEDIAGAVFLSMATSGPELLINCISTLNSNGNIGVGTIVGSAVFNSLAIPALCGFFSCASIQLDWWSISRDCSFYCLSVIALIAVIYDSQIMWYEAAFLVCCYGVYLIGELNIL